MPSVLEGLFLILNIKMEDVTFGSAFENIPLAECQLSRTGTCE